MSQSSVVLPTSGIVSGVTMATDANAALDAIRTMFSGGSAPSSDAPVEGQMWLDTSTTPTTIRQYTGSGWAVVGYLDVSNTIYCPMIGGGACTIASAGTIQLGAAAAPQSSVSISGTVAITSFGTSARTGQIFALTFQGALTLTYNGVSMILPGGQSITTAANDTALVVYLGAGNWQVLTYTIALTPVAPWNTGDGRITIRTTAASTWVMMDDGTIGSATSGASTRANADCQNLFLLLWANVSDTYAPVTGGRGGSAAADWAANKKIALTKQLGRALMIGGAGSGLTARTLGQTLGEENHTLTTAELAVHTHVVTDPTHTHTSFATANAANQGTGGSTAAGNGAGSVTGASSTGITNQNAGSGNSHNNMQPSVAWNIEIKL